MYRLSELKEINWSYLCENIFIRLQIKGIRVFLIIFILNLWSGNSYTQEGDLNFTKDSTNKAIFYFQFDKSLPLRDYKLNATSISYLARLLNDKSSINNIDSIVISASTSPEGESGYNAFLADARKKSVQTYIYWKHPDVDKDKVSIKSGNENLSLLKHLVETDENIPGRKQILDILEQKNSMDAAILNLQDIENGVSWEYMKKYMFHHLRIGIVTVFFSQENMPAISETENEPISETQIAKPVDNNEVATQEVEEQIEYKYIRPLALKTNLLFDLATAINVEVELPIAKRWSIAGEAIFPWWLWENKQYCLQILSGNLEMRYWLNPNFKNQDSSLEHHNPMTGWFVGVYGGGGIYDIEWNKKGYQGEFFISAGLSVGYVTSLSRNLNMEFSVGAGYLSTDYRRYNAIQDENSEWHLKKQEEGHYKWMGPTKAKISLIWYPHFKKRK